MYNRLILIFSIFLSSCDSDIHYIEYNSIDGVWHRDSVQNFNFDVDLNKTFKYSSFINLRITEAYRFNNIFLIVKLRDSLSTIYVDTLEYKLADKYGKFTGEKGINIIENSLLHKENISLENNKTYSISIEHAMRVINKVGGLELLEGVVDVGFKIEKVK